MLSINHTWHFCVLMLEPGQQKERRTKKEQSNCRDSTKRGTNNRGTSLVFKKQKSNQSEFSRSRKTRRIKRELKEKQKERKRRGEESV